MLAVCCCERLNQRLPTNFFICALMSKRERERERKYVESLQSQKNSFSTFFWQKIHAQNSICELMRYHGAKSMIGFSIILFLRYCFTQSAHNFKVVCLIDRIAFWQEFMMHHAIVIEENREQNLHFSPNLACFFFGFDSPGHLNWNDWALVSMSQPYRHNSTPVMNFLSKSGSTLNVDAPKKSHCPKV